MGPAALDKDAERHAATEIVEVFALPLHVLERLGQVFPELPHCLTPYGGALKHAEPERSELPDHVRRVQGECGIEVAAIDSLHDSSKHLLQVGRRGLLRHHLLLQAEVGKGAVAVPVGDHSRDPAVPNVQNARILSV